jgi:5-methyltetrahydrofolate--homocysteine methyltransferase
MNTAIAKAVEEGNLYEIEDMVSAALSAAESPKGLLEALMAGLKACGDRFETGEYFLPELIGAGDAFKRGMGIVASKLSAGDRVSQGKVVLGTVHGDVHDIGKNLVGFMLSSAGFTVVDVGVVVTTEHFVQAVREHQPQVLGMSALLTTTMLGMEDVIKELKKQGLRDKVKVIIGGGPVSKKYAEDIEADAYGNDAAQAVGLVRSLL